MTTATSTTTAAQWIDPNLEDWQEWQQELREAGGASR